jgi:hypothetical protein
MADVVRDLLLDANGDLAISGGDLALASGATALVQAVAIALRFVKGEWFYDLDAGVPYYTDVLVKSPSADVLQSVFRKALLGVRGITGVASLSLSLDRASRTLVVNWSAASDLGLLSSTVEV